MGVAPGVDMFSVRILKSDISGSWGMFADGIEQILRFVFYFTIYVTTPVYYLTVLSLLKSLNYQHVWFLGLHCTLLILCYIAIEIYSADTHPASYLPLYSVRCVSQ